MRCANPDCCCGLFDQPGGTIWLMQLEVPRDNPIESIDYGFPVSTLPTKYFWLCPDCSRRFILLRWMPTGVCLVKKQPGVRSRAATRMGEAVSPFPFSVCASPQVEEEFLDVG
jgi:hypothetical protein